MCWLMIFRGKSGGSQMVNWFARRLPTSRFVQMTPYSKVAFWLNLRSSVGADIPLVNRVIVEAAGKVESKMFEMVWENLSFLSPWTKAILTQQKSKLTTYNHWMEFLYGKGAAYRGRETYQRRVIGAAMRAAGCGTPLDATKTFAMTVATAVAMAALKKWWEGPTPGPGPETIPGPEPEPLQLPKPPLPSKPPRFGISLIDVSAPCAQLTLRDLVVYALMSMGMSRSGANDLIDGETIYGIDAQIYRRICSYIFIRCLDCDGVTVIEHEELMNAVVYFAEDDVLVSYCPHCSGFCEADVTTLNGNAEVHLH